MGCARRGRKPKWVSRPTNLSKVGRRDGVSLVFPPLPVERIAGHHFLSIPVKPATRDVTQANYKCIGDLTLFRWHAAAQVRSSRTELPQFVLNLGARVAVCVAEKALEHALRQGRFSVSGQPARLR